MGGSAMKLDASNGEFELPLPPDKDKQSIHFSAIRVTQPIGDIFVSSIGHEVLTRITYFDVRRIARTEREVETYLGIQRPLDKKRVSSLEAFVNFADASFPSSVILAIDAEYAVFHEDLSTIELRNFRDGEDAPTRAMRDIARVIDGQHRIAGLDAFQGDRFDLPVTIFVGADIADQAYVFSTVNLEQTKVSKSLAYDLFALAKTRSPQKTCHNIAIALDLDRDSPFFQKIKRLGFARPDRNRETITQAAFVEMLMQLITTAPKQDRDDLLRGKRLRPASDQQAARLVFRSLFIDERDVEIGQNVKNYFNAIRYQWPEDWEFEGLGIILSRTNGFRAFMRILPLMYSYLKPSTTQPVVAQEDFARLIARIPIERLQFNTERFPPGTSGESKIVLEVLDALPFLRDAQPR